MKQYKVTVNQDHECHGGSGPLTRPVTRSTVIFLSVTTSAKADTLDDLKKVPITTQSGKIVYLEDIADVYDGRTDGRRVPLQRTGDDLPLRIQEAGQLRNETSSDVKSAVESLEAADSGLPSRSPATAPDSIKSSSWTLRRRWSLRS